MSWDVVMFGSLSVPERNVEEWLTSASPRAEHPWLDELGGEDAHPDIPEVLLTWFEDVIHAPHELFDVRLEDGRLTVQCFASEELYRSTCEALAHLFASAAAFGGTGELFFSGYRGIRFGERVSVAHGRVSLRTLAQEELGTVERQAAYHELEARIHERYDALVGRPSAPADARRTRWSVNPFTGRKVRVAAEP